MRAGAAMGVELDGPVGDREPQGRSDRALDEADFTTVGANKLGRDGKAETSAAGAS